MTKSRTKKHFVVASCLSDLVARRLETRYYPTLGCFTDHSFSSETALGGTVNSAAVGLVHGGVFDYCIYHRLRRELLLVEESHMRNRQQEKQRIAEVLREELEEAGRRIHQRFSEFERPPVASKDDSLDGVRRFYQDLTDNDWTMADEEALGSLTDWSEEQTKRMMREAFRRSRVHPIPSFATLINVAKKGPGTSPLDGMAPFANPDAVPAAERERMANLLHRGLRAAAGEIAVRLELTGTKADVVREQLEDVEGAIISEFTPLV